MNLSPDILRPALEGAGFRSLPPEARTWIGGRLTRYGSTVYPDGRLSLAGLQCTALHMHGSNGFAPDGPDGPCVGGVAIFDHPDDAAIALCRAAYRASATPAEPRADFAAGVKTKGEAKTGDVGPLDFLLPGTSVLWNAITGPSAEAETLFRDLSADWVSFEAAGVPDKYPELRADHDRWIAYRDAWHRGQAEPKDLLGYGLDANRVRRVLYEKTREPQFSKDQPREIDPTQSTNVLQAAQAADTVAREVQAAIPSLPHLPSVPDISTTPEGLWAKVPTWIKWTGGFLIAGYATALVVPFALPLLSGLYAKRKLSAMDPAMRRTVLTTVTGNPVAAEAAAKLL